MRSNSDRYGFAVYKQTTLDLHPCERSLELAALLLLKMRLHDHDHDGLIDSNVMDLNEVDPGTSHPRVWTCR